MLLFADREERRFVQAIQIGGVVAVIGSMFIVLGVLDNPYHGGSGSLQPVAMERSLALIDEALSAVDRSVTLPCDDAGVRAE